MQQIDSSRMVSTMLFLKLSFPVYVLEEETHCQSLLSESSTDNNRPKGHRTFSLTVKNV